MIKIRHIPKPYDYSIHKTKIYGKGWSILWNFLTGLESGEEVKKAIGQLKYFGNTPMWESCYAIKKDNLVHLIDICIRYKNFYLPYDQFIDLLDQWKLVLEQQHDKHAFDHDYNQLIIFADDDYNFTITVDNRMIENQN